MSTPSLTLHICDLNSADEEPIVSLNSSVIPRIGDEVGYWVDYPENLSAEKLEQGDIIRITGTVGHVKIEYRRSIWGSTPPTLEPMAIIFLKFMKIERREL